MTFDTLISTIYRRVQEIADSSKTIAEILLVLFSWLTTKINFFFVSGGGLSVNWSGDDEVS